jgi:hypothetical protein
MWLYLLYSSKPLDFGCTQPRKAKFSPHTPYTFFKFKWPAGGGYIASLVSFSEPGTVGMAMRMHWDHIMPEKALRYANGQRNMTRPPNGPNYMCI